MKEVHSISVSTHVQICTCMHVVQLLFSACHILFYKPCIAKLASNMVHTHFASFQTLQMCHHQKGGCHCHFVYTLTLQMISNSNVLPKKTWPKRKHKPCNQHKRGLIDFVCLSLTNADVVAKIDILYLITKIDVTLCNLNLSYTPPF